ncbi:hypothetical protein ACWF94_09280 [Streptomyces sp. NPDC055078]
MTNGQRERLEQLVTNAASQLGAESPWLMVSAAPACPAQAGFNADSGDAMQRWVRRQVTDWPAPVAIGSEQPDIRADKLTFAPPRPPGRSAGTYYCELHADGAALGALQVGTLRDSPRDGRQVWTLGEGAVAWITIAMLRLTAAFARQAAVLGEAAVEVTLIPAADPDQAAPMEVWNHADKAYGPAGDRRAGGIGSARHTVNLAECLSPRLTAVARPFVIDLLRQFGRPGSRHVDPAGVIRRGHFTGYEAVIHTWADAIGVPSEP